MSIAVDPAYRHYPKQARFVAARTVGAATLKCYHLTAPDAPVPETVVAQADAWFTAHAPDELAAGDCGFVIVHRCGADFHFLLASVWRGSNELWEAVWYRMGDMTAFAPFDAAYPPDVGVVRPTFCVWELGIVAHESAAWGRYLASSRDGTALAVWKGDGFDGVV